MKSAFPISLTSLLGVIGTTVDINCGTFPSGLTSGAMIGFAGDVSKKIYLDTVKKRRQSQNNLLERVTEDYYLTLVANEVRKHHNLHGRWKTVTAFSPQEGTYTSKGGYFAEVRFIFEDGEAKLLYKYLDRPTLIARNFINDAKKQGHEFIPHNFTPRKLLSLDDHEAPRGTFYEWIDGETLEKSMGESQRSQSSVSEEEFHRTFDALSSIYSGDLMLSRSKQKIPPHVIQAANGKDLVNWRLSQKGGRNYGEMDEYKIRRFQTKDRDYKFHGDLVKKITSDELSTALSRYFEELFPWPRIVIHGDLHQGNILNHGKQIIDWDNVQYGVPYHDVAHFALISDFNRSSSYREIKRTFLERQQSLLPFEFTKEHESLIDFEVALSLLERYATADIRSEFRESMNVSCRYLLEECRTSAPLPLKRSVESYLINKFPQISSLPYDASASVAYAHSINHKFSKKQHSMMENLGFHSDSIEALVIAEESSKSLAWMGAGAIAAFGLSLYGVAEYAKTIPLAASLKIQANHIVNEALVLGLGAFALGIPVPFISYYFAHKAREVSREE